jgi:hypothetical protein
VSLNNLLVKNENKKIDEEKEINIELADSKFSKTGYLEFIEGKEFSIILLTKNLNFGLPNYPKLSLNSFYTVNNYYPKHFYQPLINFLNTNNEYFIEPKIKFQMEIIF